MITGTSFKLCRAEQKSCEDRAFALGKELARIFKQYCNVPSKKTTEECVGNLASILDSGFAEEYNPEADTGLGDIFAVGNGYVLTVSKDRDGKTFHTSMACKELRTMENYLPAVASSLFKNLTETGRLSERTAETFIKASLSAAAYEVELLADGIDDGEEDSDDN